MRFSTSTDEIGRFRFTKVLRLMAIIVRIIYHRFADGAQVLYYPPAGPDRVPMLWRDIVILISSCWLFEKTVFHFHAGGISELYDVLPSWQRWLFRRALFGADAAVRLSELTIDDGKRLQAKREYVIPNGIDDPCPGLVVSPSKSGANRNDPLRILFVGFLCESKGIMVLIEACARLASRGISFRLDVMGQWRSDEFAAQATSRVEELNLAEHVRFLGILTGETKFAVFCRADVFCFPSFFNCEAFPIVLLEASACSLPIVLTRWRGIPSLVRRRTDRFLGRAARSRGSGERTREIGRKAELRELLGRAGALSSSENTLTPDMSAG